MTRVHSSLDSLINQLTAEFHAHRASDSRPFLIAIDGRSGAGKSTLAAQMADHFNALLIPGDDFYSGGIAERDEPPKTLVDDCIDWSAIKVVLTDLLLLGEAHYHAFDWEAFDGSRCPNPTHLTTRSVILVEGVYAARPELQDFFDFTLLVDPPETARMRQLLRREGEIGPWERQWHRAEDWYFEQMRRPGDFDAVLRLPDDRAAPA